MMSLKQTILTKDVGLSIKNIETIEVKTTLGKYNNYDLFPTKYQNPLSSDSNVILTSLCDEEDLQAVYTYANEERTERQQSGIFYDQPDFLEDISTVSGMSFDQIIKTASEIPDLYGVLIKIENKNLFLNPLHPLIALSIIEKEYTNPVRHSMNLTGIFYKINDKYLPDLKAQQSNYDYNAIMTRVYKAFQNRIIDISIKSTTKTSDEIAEEISLMPIYSIFHNNKYLQASVESSTSNVSIQIASDEPVENPQLSVLIPVQLQNKQFIMPYYGIVDVVGLDNQDLPKGKNIAPMLSANVSSRLTTNLGSICCGKESAAHLQGLRLINHSNLNSPYVRDGLCSGWYNWVQYCIKESLDLYRRAEWLK